MPKAPSQKTALYSQNGYGSKRGCCPPPWRSHRCVRICLSTSPVSLHKHGEPRSAPRVRMSLRPASRRTANKRDTPHRLRPREACIDTSRLCESAQTLAHKIVICVLAVRAMPARSYRLASWCGRKAFPYRLASQGGPTYHGSVALSLSLQSRAPIHFNSACHRNHGHIVWRVPIACTIGTSPRAR